MTLFYSSILAVVIGNIIYHIAQKSVPHNANPYASLIVTYVVALIVTTGLLIFLPRKFTIAESFKGLNWSAFAVGFGIVLVEVGFLLAYRHGWKMSQAALFSTTAVTILLIPIGLSFYKESFGTLNIIGIVVALAGLFMMTR